MLSLLLLIPLGLIFRKNKYYLNCSWLKPLKNSNQFLLPFKLNQSLLIISFLSLILASLGIFMSQKVQEKHILARKYVLVNDGSGSMLDQMAPKGIGVRIKSLLAGNKAFCNGLAQRNDGYKDLVAALVFSNHSFIISYLSEDCNFVFNKIQKVNYNQSPLGLGTRMEKALWGAIALLLDEDDDLEYLSEKMFGFGSLKLDPKMEELIAKIKLKTDNDIVIAFTDGELPEVEGNNFYMSIVKILELYKKIGIKFYFLSLENMDKIIVNLSKDTGGDAILIKENQKAFESIYTTILNNQLKDFKTVEKTINQPLTTILGIVSLICFVVWFICKNTFCFKLTEI